MDEALDPGFQLSTLAMVGSAQAATPSAAPAGGHGSMSGMDHASVAPMAQAGHDAMWWVAIVGLPLMAWLLWSAGRDLWRAITQPTERLDNLSGFAMNFGMFWMSTGLLVPVLPFFSQLAF